MATLIDTLSQTMTPQVLGTIGKKIGVDEATMQTGMDAAVPAVLGGLSKTASSPTGLDDIMKQLPQATDGDDPLSSVLGTLLGGGVLGGFLGGAASARSMGDSGPLGGLLGPGIIAIGAMLSKKLGFNVTPILAIAAPLVLGAISKAANQQKLDKQGVANLVQTESKAFMDKGGPTATLVQEALAAGDEAAALKGKFTADEWRDVRLAPLAAAKFVMAASVSGPIGMVKELSAGASTVAETAQAAAPASLLTMAFGQEMSDADMNVIQNENDKEALLGMIKSAVASVSANDAAEAFSYRKLVMDTATKVAEAAKEGTFLGIGGTKVSKEEEAALASIQRAIAA